jgi:site-specific DNA-adenine methylase
MPAQQQSKKGCSKKRRSPAKRAEYLNTHYPKNMVRRAKKAYMHVVYFAKRRIKKMDGELLEKVQEFKIKALKIADEMGRRCAKAHGDLTLIYFDKWLMSFSPSNLIPLKAGSKK